jgi:hypothetical protein
MSVDVTEWVDMTASKQRYNTVGTKAFNVSLLNCVESAYIPLVAKSWYDGPVR